MDSVEHLKWVRKFKAKTYAYFSLLKDGTVGIILVVASMKQ